MLVKAPKIQVPKDNPFQFDVLNRAENAIILTQLISTIDEPFVLSIDSKWGSGKTTFISMWKQYLENNEYKVIHFNAWENDISNDALSALVAELKKGIQTAPDETTSSKLFSNVKTVSAKILKRSIPVVVKLATAGIIDTNEMAKDLISSATEKFALDSIESYEKRQEDIMNFKQELENFAQSLYGESNKPLIFFIDELDRCRPNFAIEVLEKAKHLFNVKNILFVISIDKIELGYSIKAIYGNQFDTDGYLRRFIDLNYYLPAPNTELFCKFLVERFQFNAFFEKRTHPELRYDHEHFIKISFNLFSLVNFSLRTIEQCFTQISIVLRTIPDNKFMYPVLLVFLIFLKNHNPDLYRKLKQGQCKEEEIYEYLYSLDTTYVFMKTQIGLLLEANVMSSVCNYLNKNKEVHDFIQKHYYEPLKNPEIESDHKQRLEHINHLMSNLNWGFSDHLKYLFDKIEISQQFVS
ncbi:P-loop NTPase fold protein [Desulfosporosinus sp. FKB]|uniref:KAP family P-loop NTPase fold protein n=1 Tax=Desulfosporosinus sp. FKB TaxID=1969835 RepID=UPI000B4A349C|nr:P-loop NTPase fold protein [Desulfosporosinus sp. FKB]